MELRKNIKYRKANAKSRKSGVYTPSETYTGISARKKVVRKAVVAGRPEIPKKTIKTAQGMATHSKGIQFPVTEKLEDGRHRYFLKYGTVVDRLR